MGDNDRVLTQAEIDALLPDNANKLKARQPVTFAPEPEEPFQPRKVNPPLPRQPQAVALQPVVTASPDGYAEKIDDINKSLAILAKQVMKLSRVSDKIDNLEKQVEQLSESVKTVNKTLSEFDKRLKKNQKTLQKTLHRESSHLSHEEQRENPVSKNVTVLKVKCTVSDSSAVKRAGADFTSPVHRPVQGGGNFFSS
jgi:TolA-binding protein